MFGTQNTGGQWSEEESQLHSNELELKAIEFGLKVLNHVHHVHIRIRSDDSTAVSYINNLGGVKSLRCHRLAKAIWIWAIDRDVHFSAEHLPGSKNNEADAASSIFDANTEWSLPEGNFYQMFLALFLLIYLHLG